MLQPYLRELAPYFGGSYDPNAVFDYPYLDAYWQEPGDRYPYLITANRTTAGFAFVNHHSRLNTPYTKSVAEFYILPEFRRSGVGQVAAAHMFRQFPGPWEVAVLSGNKTAEQFWIRAIATVADGEISEHTTGSWDGTIFTFTVADQSDVT